MRDGVTYTMDDDAVIAALTTLGDSAKPYINVAAATTADAIIHEANARLGRQLGPKATGRTLAGITTRPAFDGNGVIVISEREPFPNVPLWLEKGTKGKHKQVARPYFYVSALLEEGPHRRRIEDAVHQAIDAKGLGE